jgi:hypothetical protein
MLALSVLLLIIVIAFSFGVLIPNGKEYRLKKAEFKKESMKLRQLSDYAFDTSTNLQKLQGENRHIITAFAAPFSIERFEKQHREYFTSLKLSKLEQKENEENFAVYEVNASSKINSPKSFYKFLDALNKSDWIIAVNFPINFKRDGELIHSSFTMKVYSDTKDKKDSNTSGDL